MVILSMDPLAVEVQGAEEDGQAAAPALPSRVAAASATGAAGALLWHDMLHEFYTLGARCMVLARRTTAYMAMPPAGERLLPVDDGCVRLLVACPTSRMSSPLWAHVNVCRTCSSRVLRLLQSTWQARDAAGRQGGAMCGEGCGSDGAGGHSRLGVIDASRELTVLGQTAVSRQLVIAVWHRYAAELPFALHHTCGCPSCTDGRACLPAVWLCRLRVALRAPARG